MSIERESRGGRARRGMYGVLNPVLSLLISFLYKKVRRRKNVTIQHTHPSLACPHCGQPILPILQKPDEWAPPMNDTYIPKPLTNSVTLEDNFKYFTFKIF